MPEFTYNAFKSAFVVYGVPGLIAVGMMLAAFFIGRFALIKWMETHFQQRLEFYKSQAQIAAENQKHDLQKIIEEKKYEINARFDRNTRINQLEFEMLPDLWYKLNDAILKTQSLFGLRQYSDVSKMTDEKLIARLKNLEFDSPKIEDIIQSSDRQKAYQNVTDWIDYGSATSAFNELAISIRKRAIFVRPELFDEFKSFEDIIKAALIEYDMNRNGFYQHRQYESSLKLSSMAGESLSSLEEKIRGRLWNSMSR